MSSKLKIETAAPCSFLRGCKRPLAAMGRAVLETETTRTYSALVIAVDDAMITSLNERFLGRRLPTDVIAFPLGESDSGELYGEVYISCETARAQAREYNVKPVEEFARLMVHGLLHLCGFRDHTPILRKKMTALENRYMKEHGIALGAPAPVDV